MTQERPTRIVKTTEGKLSFVEIKGQWIACTPESTVDNWIQDQTRRNGDTEVNFRVRRENAKIEVVPPV